MRSWMAASWSLAGAVMMVKVVIGVGGLPSAPFALLAGGVQRS